MKKWIGLMALTTAAATTASTALATSLYEPFNYPNATNNEPLGSGALDPVYGQGVGATAASPFTGGFYIGPNTSEVPSQSWSVIATPSATIAPGDTKYVTASSISIAGEAPSAQTGGVAQLTNVTKADRMNLNAAYGPGSTIYYSMILEVPLGTAYANTGTAGSIVAGFQWTNPTNTGSTSYTSTAWGGGVGIRHTDSAGNVLTNPTTGNPEFEMLDGATNNGTNGSKAYDDTDILQEGVPYLVVVKYTMGTNNFNDTTDLYISPAESTFGQADPGLTSAAHATVAVPFFSNGYYGGSANGNGYIGSHVSLMLQETTSLSSAIDITDIQVAGSWAGVTAVEWTGGSGVGNSNWSNSANWSTSGASVYPNAVGADVIFGAASSGTVTVDQPTTAGTIQFTSSTAATIGGSSTLTLKENVAPETAPDGGWPNPNYLTTGGIYGNPADSYSPATIQVMTGSHSITAPVTLASNLQIGVNPGTSLSMSNVTAGTGAGIAVLGGGNVTITPSSPTALQGLAGSAQDDRGLGHIGGDQGQVIPSTAGGLYGLSVQQGSTLKIGAVKGAIITNGILMDSTSTLDLTNNALIVNYNNLWDFSTQAYDTPDTTTGPGLVAAAVAAYDHGAWDKPGVTSSAASFAAGTTVGVIDNANGTAANQVLSVDGVAVTGSTAAAMYTWYGDANLDGVVNSTDLGMISATGTTWETGDFNYDGVVNGDDWSLYFLGAAASGGKNISSVPEPGTALMMVAGVAAVATRRRRKCSAE